QRRAARKVYFAVSQNEKRLEDRSRSHVVGMTVTRATLASKHIMDDSPESLAPNVASLERDVKARSATLKKELGLFDLVLTQVVFVVGTIWVGWAAKLGY